MENTRSKRTVLYFTVGLTLLLILRDIVGFSMNKFLLVGFVLLFTFIANTEAIPMMLSFMFPLAWGLPYTYIFLGAIILYWFKRRGIPRISLGLIIGFAALEITASIFYPSTDYIAILKYMSVLSIFFTFLYDRAIDKKEVIKYFFAGLVVLCAVIIISTIKTAPSNWLYLFSRGWFRFGSKQAVENDGMMLKVNANTLAYYSIVGVSIGLYYIKTNKEINKWIFIGSIILLAISGVFTVSRSWILVTAICIFLFIVDESKSIKGVAIGGLIIIVVLFAGYKIIQSTPELLEGFTRRFTADDFSTSGGRTDLFMEYDRAFWSNIRFPLIGTGVTQYRAMTNVINSFHNMIQQIVVSYGIPFAIVFFAGMFAPLKWVRGRKLSIVTWIPFVAVLLFTQTIQFINPETLMLPYIIAVYILMVEAEKQDNGELI
jgi:hypothetical protein